MIATTATAAATQSANAVQNNGQNGSGNTQNGNTNQQQSSGTANSNSVGITSEQAIANVKAQVGDDVVILSCVEGVTPDSDAFRCYVITVSVQSDNGEFVNETYCSGYLFCYKAG